MTAGAHRLDIRVYYEDTDAGGIVYHANYLRFAERARTEVMRAIGWAHGRLAREAGGFWAVRRLEIEYLKPARLDDLLTVETRLTAIGGARVSVGQVIRAGAAELARLALEVALVRPDGRPLRLPASLRHSLAPLLVKA